MLTERDIKMFKFINIYGKTYLPVLGRTFFNTEQQARNRINTLSKQNAVSYWNTGLMTPRRAVALSPDTKRYFEDILDIAPKKTQINMSTIHHNMIEQMAHYWLLKIGEVERTSVAKHGSILNHVPDLILTLPSGSKVYIEVEMQKKSQARYSEIFDKMSRDDPAQIMYVVPKKEYLENFAKFFPIWKKIALIDIDTLIENVKNTGKASPQKQEVFLL